MRFVWRRTEGARRMMPSSVFRAEFARKGLDIHAKMEYYHFDVNVKVCTGTMKDKMRIGEFAEQAGVTPRTIRYYEDLGLLGPNEREGQGFRYYTSTELATLKKIDWLKQLGMRLEEIGEVLPLYCDDPTGLRGKQRTLEILQAHLAETDEKIESLQSFRSELQENIDRIQHYIHSKRAE
jgi:MerR family transcriptional regulator, copper efflux regulator